MLKRLSLSVCSFVMVLLSFAPTHRILADGSTPLVVPFSELLRSTLRAVPGGSTAVYQGIRYFIPTGANVGIATGAAEAGGAATAGGATAVAEVGTGAAATGVGTLIGIPVLIVGVPAGIAGAIYKYQEYQSGRQYVQMAVNSLINDCVDYYIDNNGLSTSEAEAICKAKMDNFQRSAKDEFNKVNANQAPAMQNYCKQAGSWNPLASPLCWILGY